jgi:hypothetical protein
LGIHAARPDPVVTEPDQTDDMELKTRSPDFDRSY